MILLEDAIGRDMSTYRIAHLGINTAPALMHGFYTVDGYSNNYPLEYKHRFRKYIEKELEKIESVRLYFDEWGNRCYTFNGASRTAWMLGKKNHIVYEGLELDMDALKSLGGEYIFSCGEIMNAEELGLAQPDARYFCGHYHKTLFLSKWINCTKRLPTDSLLNMTITLLQFSFFHFL